MLYTCWGQTKQLLYRVSLLLLFIGLLLLPDSAGSECDPAPGALAGYSFLRPELVDPTMAGVPYLVPFAELYSQYGDQQRELQEDDNAAEWQQRYCEVPKLEDVKTLVYQSSLTEFDYLRSAIGSRTAVLPPLLADNSFARYLVRFNCVETADYFIYAKQCEPHVVWRDSWSENPRNIAAMQRLIDEARSRFLSVESHYIRLRYAYQMIRLAHYAGLHEQVLELYDYLMPKIDNDPSLIAYWIEGHRAGALLALGDNIQASYLYAKVFHHCPSRRESALRSYRLRSDEEWQKCLLMCETDEERAALYAMRAYSPNSKAVEDMERIYELNPLSQHLEPLLVREMSRLERLLLGREFRRLPGVSASRSSQVRTEAGEETVELQKLVRRVLTEREVVKVEFWKVAEGYLELLAGDYYASSRSFRQARDIVSSQGLRQQLELFELLGQIAAWNTVNDEVEREAAKIMRDKRFDDDPDFSRYLNGKLTVLYRENKRPGKAFLSEYPFRFVKPNPQMAILDDLLAVCARTEPTRLEKRMISLDDGQTICDEVIDIRATLLFSNYQLEAALETLKRMDRSAWDKFVLTNPYVERINDCVHCPLPDSMPLLNRGQLIENLLDLEYKARANPDTAAIYYFRLGVGFYNMSYFSYAWKAMDFFRSGVSINPRYLRNGDNVIPHPIFPEGNVEHFDCSQALYYFLKARDAATDRELAAKATFWAAKCERNEYYLNRVKGAQRTYDFFSDLKQRYRDTQYYQRVIAECKTFSAFAAK